MIDQIEVLKQQLRVYADDFATEREDRERNQAEKEKMREELNAVREQVQALEQQVGFISIDLVMVLMVILMGRQTSEMSVFTLGSIYNFFRNDLLLHCNSTIHVHVHVHGATQ